ncbi:MAG TPA: SusC/RagA family TonB-linked outer membrane protein, partial [Prolixibacteraceae bacterium]|nr:SusC/RagA family TonB-linked outer membrane protein [Prolixibacteraceae bacterium]
TIGTITDFDGNFNLVIPADSKFLTVSFVGLKTQEITIGSQTNFMISLSEETVGLEEVVVVGYGTQKKESVVGAITQVDNQSLVRSGTQNVTNAITGKLSGVLTIQQTGEPGSDNSEIIIRGLSSWNGSQPLVLVDGVERDFKSIDPNEVNTISVLKDASATAVFGAKGANGVIIVTTRRGIIGKPKMNFSGSYGLEKATRIPDHIDSYTTMSLLNVARMNGGQFEQLTPTHILDEYRNPSTPLNSLRYPNVDWFDLLTHPYAPTSNANFNVSGGTNFIKYFCSLGHLYQNDFFKTYKNGYDDARYWYHRINYRANIDFNLTKSTVFSLNVGGDVGIKNQPNSSPWRNLYATSPARFPAYFPEWVLEMVPDPDYPDANGIRLVQPFGEYTGNPYNNMHNGTFRRYLDTKLFTDLVLEQKLDFITKGLSFKGKASLSTYFRNNSLKADYSFPEYQLDYDKIGTNENPWYRSGQGDEVWYQAPLDINVGGLEGGYYRDMYYEMALSYGNTFAQNHSVSGLALINFQQKNSGTDFAYYNAGVVGRATYDYKHKYLFEVNVGYTGSERFAPGNRFGFFPSGAVGWTISEEEFFKNAVPWMNKLKVRYSDGKVGSDKAGSRWLYMSDYYTDGRGYIREDKGANVTAQWEEARKRDIGVEFGIFNNLISASVDFFDEQREKMLLSPRTVTVLVGNTFKELNKGSLKKHGFEVELEFNKTTASQLNYWVKGIFGFNENRIIYKDDFPYAPDYTKDAGKPLGAQLNGVLLTGTGYFTSIDDIHNNPSPIISEKLNVGDYKYLDYSADGAITNLDKYPIDGSLYPPITDSFSSGFSWKGFDFHLMFQGNEGKFVDFN